MYSKEEARTIRIEFWDRFRGYSTLRRRQKGKPEKWIMNRTGIKALNFRFYIDRQKAIVGIDIETNNMDNRIKLFEKLESLKSILEKRMKTKITWDVEYTRENGKTVSRVYVVLENVDVYNRDHWPIVFKFFYSNMMKLESFYEEYRDFLRYG